MTTEEEVQEMLEAVVPPDRAAQDTYVIAAYKDSPTDEGEVGVRQALMTNEEQFGLAEDALDALWTYVGLERGWPS